MANRYFQKYKQALLTDKANCPNLTTDDIRAVFIDIGVHDPDTSISGNGFLSDIPAGARIMVSANLATKTVVDAVFDAADVTVTDSGGATVEEIVLYYHTGTESTSRLLICIDTATGLPLTPDSVTDQIRWHTSGIAAL